MVGRALALVCVLALTAACGGGSESTATPAAQRTAAADSGAVSIGDTVTGIPKGYGAKPFSMTFQACIKSGVAVEGPYGETYYTFTAKPGMRFLILQFRFTNGDKRQQTTPYVDAGEVLTDPAGNFYQVWGAPAGIESEEYGPRPATQQEQDALWGDPGAFKTLLPGESVNGRVVFQVPAETTPVEATLAYVPAKVSLRGQCQ